VRRIGYSVGALLVLAGMFWSGRESSHGFSALWEHWWCPIPIVAIAVGLATAWLLARSSSQTS
jgi:apolipoprotein N-acyltransferase